MSPVVLRPDDKVVTALWRALCGTFATANAAANEKCPHSRHRAIAGI
jgi:hypothetical protein